MCIFPGFRVHLLKRAFLLLVEQLLKAGKRIFCVSLSYQLLAHDFLHICCSLNNEREAEKSVKVRMQGSLVGWRGEVISRTDLNLL